jgi:LAS superfamily LD-carboxypeptidase LdcB
MFAIDILKKITVSILFSLLFAQYETNLPVKEIKKEEVISPPKQEVVEESKVIEEVKKPVPIPPKPNKPQVATNWWSYPQDIKQATRSGDDLLVLVNKEYTLGSEYAPSDLVSAANSGIRKGQQYMLRNVVINDLAELVNAAKNDGIDLSMRSGYRSYQTQVSTYQYWLRHNKNVVDDADKISARAGHSQHQLGTAVDFSTSEIQDGIGGRFQNTKAAKWLAENAWKYGFVISFPKGYESITGYNYESWHYRYIGKANAQEMINSGEILEIYLRGKN